MSFDKKLESFTQKPNGPVMALPTHQVKLFILFLDGTPIPTTRPIFTVLFGKGKCNLSLQHTHFVH